MIQDNNELLESFDEDSNQETISFISSNTEKIKATNEDSSSVEKKKRGRPPGSKKNKPTEKEEPKPKGRPPGSKNKKQSVDKEVDQSTSQQIKQIEHSEDKSSSEKLASDKLDNMSIDKIITSDNFIAEYYHKGNNSDSDEVAIESDPTVYGEAGLDRLHHIPPFSSRPKPVGFAKAKQTRKPSVDELIARLPYPYQLPTLSLRKLYYNYLSSAIIDYGAKLTIFNARLTESIIIKAHALHGDGLSLKDLEIQPNQLISSTDAILTKLWNTRIGRTHKLYIIGDTIAGAKFYRYTGGIPTYVPITESEMYNLVYLWLSNLFNSLIPSEVSTKTFVSKLLDQLIIQHIISIQVFNSVHRKTGVPFENGFLNVEVGQPQMDLLPYSEDLFVDQNQIHYPYLAPLFEGDSIVLSQSTRNLIKVLTGNRPDTVAIFRVLLRRALTSSMEGRNFQTGIYISGPPGTGKSFVTEIIKELVPRHQIQELNKTHNQFSNGQFEDCRILLVSDLKVLTENSVEILKRMLGRDGMNRERKFIDGVGYIEPYLTIIFVSNIDLNYFWPLKRDQAIVEKLLCWRFTEDEVIPPHLQVANARAMVGKYLAELINWAMHIPLKVLQGQVRASTYIDYQDQFINKEATLQVYLADHYWYGPDEWISINDFKSDLERFVELSGNDSLKNYFKYNNKVLTEIIVREIKKAFGFECFEQRRTKSDAAGVRPYGIQGLKLIPKDAEQVPEGCKVLEPKRKSQSLDLPDIYDASRDILWFPEDPNILDRVNEMILESRRANLLVSRLESDSEEDELDEDELSDPSSVEADYDPTND